MPSGQICRILVIHMVYQEKIRVSGRTVRETWVIGVTGAGVGTGLGTICLAHPYSLGAAARDMGLGSWVGEGGVHKYQIGVFFLSLL